MPNIYFEYHLFLNEVVNQTFTLLTKGFGLLALILRIGPSKTQFEVGASLTTADLRYFDLSFDTVFFKNLSKFRILGEQPPKSLSLKTQAFTGVSQVAE